MKRAKIIGGVQEHLAHELQDRRVADELTKAIYACCLDWSYPTATSSIGAKAVIAFSFGQRRLPNGNRVPGPNNEALARLCVALFPKVRCTVYAQWEIAEAIGDSIPPSKLVPIYPPEPDPELGTERYLSTVGVLAEVEKLAGSARKLGKVLLLAFQDHMPRCVALAREMGFDAYAPPNVALPAEYDKLDAQPWVRERRAYLMHTMLSLLERYRAKTIGTGSFSKQLD